MALIDQKSELSNYYNRFNNAPGSTTPYNKRVLIDPKMLVNSSDLLSLNPVFKDFNTDLSTPNKFYGYDTNDIQQIPTNLKSLKFGNDQPGGGNSGLPYVKTSINTGTRTVTSNANAFGRESVISTFPIFRPGSSGNPDYPIRGGQINFQSGQQTFTVSNEIDRYRIASFMKDPSRGNTFIQKQIGLQLTNPKIETQPGVTFGVGQQLPFSGLLENTRIYNQGKNTLAQVANMGTGAHGVRHGTLPFNPFQKAYYYTVNQQNVFGNNRGSDENRLVILAATKMNEENQFGIGGASVNVNKLNSLGISLDRRILFQYLGGPGSTYGIGSTTIYRTVDTARLKSENVKYIKENPPTNYLEVVVGTNFYSSSSENRLLDLRNSKIAQIGSISGRFNLSPNQDFLLEYANGPGYNVKGQDGKITVDKTQTRIGRYENTTIVKSTFASIYSQLASETVNESIYKSIDRENNTGIVTKKTRDIQDYKGEWSQNFQDKNLKPVDYRFYLKETKVDKLNRMYPFWFENTTDPWDESDPYGSTDDMIKFVFEAISNNNTSVSTALFFRAHLNGAISDNNTATWNSFKYFGRGENFYTYQGFERSMNFSFRMYASSEQEMRPMYNRLNNLISQVYPDYSSAGVMRAPIMQLTIGDYIRRMPGILESVNVTINNETSWEIKESVGQLPHLVDVNVSFKPILTTLPRRANSLNTPYVPSIIANKKDYVDQDVLSLGQLRRTGNISDLTLQQQQKLDQMYTDQYKKGTDYLNTELKPRLLKKAQGINISTSTESAAQIQDRMNREMRERNRLL